MIKPAAPAVMATGVYAGQTLPDSGLPMLLLDCAGIATVAGLQFGREDGDRRGRRGSPGTKRVRAAVRRSGRRAPAGAADHHRPDRARAGRGDPLLRRPVAAVGRGPDHPARGAGRMGHALHRLGAAPARWRRREWSGDRLCDRRGARHRHLARHGRAGEGSRSGGGSRLDRRRADRTARSPLAVRDSRCRAWRCRAAGLPDRWRRIGLDEDVPQASAGRRGIPRRDAD